ncbi:hypothetical protein FALCPG4_001834 [Fusarium falciforme]
MKPGHLSNAAAIQGEDYLGRATMLTCCRLLRLLQSAARHVQCLYVAVMANTSGPGEKVSSRSRNGHQTSIGWLKRSTKQTCPRNVGTGMMTVQGTANPRSD